MVDAARDFQARATGNACERDRPDTKSGIVLIKNDTDETL
jgi:hypothetical protein